jgi:putative RecB family exonuclease
MTQASLAVPAPMPRCGSVWDYLSPSRLNCWLTCPLKWKLHYLDGIRAPTTPALFLGKQVHAGLEHFYRHRMLGISLEAEGVIARMEETWPPAVAEEEMHFESAAEETALKQQAMGLVRAYLGQMPRDEPRPLAVEVPMEVPLVDPETGEDLGIPLLGIADLVLDGTQGPAIIDFKTSSRAAPPLEIAHEVQLTSYAYLFRQTSGQREHGLEIRSLVKTKTPKVQTHGYAARTEGHFRRLFAVVREYLDALAAGRFNYRPGWGCGMCEFRDTHCRRWSGCAAMCGDNSNTHSTGDQPWKSCSP